MGKKCISIVVPMYNEQESLQILYRELNRVTREMGDYDFEYLFVNDGSKDATLQKIRELAAEDERVHYLSFSRNFGKEAALLAGLSYAKGGLCDDDGCGSAGSAHSFATDGCDVRSRRL